MHYQNSIFITLAFLLLSTARAGTIQLSKRDDPFWVDAFKGNSPTGDPQQQEQQNAAAGMVADVTLDCGTVKITSNTNKVTQCEFMLPTSGMAAGQTFTGTPAAGYFTIAVTGACHDKYQIGAGNRCTGCGDIGEIPNKLDCHGKAGGGKNTVSLCVSGTELVEC